MSPTSSPCSLPRQAALVLLALAVLACAGGCKILRPSNARNWNPDQAVLSYADIDGDRVTVHNVRNLRYITGDDYVLQHYDKTYRLSEVTSVDFIVMPFKDNPLLAHTMLSFGFNEREFLGVSVEIRKEQGEEYGPLKGFYRQYEIMYVIGDERDLIQLCTNHLDLDVYVYRVRTTPERAQAAFIDVLQRTNKLVQEPEFYNTATNNCTTNIVRHVHNVAPNRVPFNAGVLLPGLADQYAHQLGIIDNSRPFEEVRAAARVNDLARQYASDPNFSRRIRRLE